MALPVWICHQKPERCFKFKNKLFPLCARCFGLYLFMVLGFVISLIFNISIRLNKGRLLIIIILMCLPLFIDSITQLLKLRESNNSLRFITGSLAGFICGIGLHYIVIQLIL